MQWMQGQAALFAYGSEHGYLVIREETGVRLTRFRIAAGADGLAAVVALEAARNLIFLPLGRGPGRPGGDPELAALIESAKTIAERFESGEDPEFTGWQHATERVRAGLHDPYAGPRPFRLGQGWEAERGGI